MGGEAVFVARGLTKAYRMGEVEVRALPAGARGSRRRRRNARWAAADAGLAEGETAILYPTDALSDGVRVRTR